LLPWNFLEIFLNIVLHRTILRPLANTGNRTLRAPYTFFQECDLPRVMSLHLISAPSWLKEIPTSLEAATSIHDVKNNIKPHHQA
jgi:hypothetical protein